MLPIKRLIFSVLPSTRNTASGSFGLIFSLVVGRLERRVAEPDGVVALDDNLIRGVEPFPFEAVGN